jgi:hypothetical protein
MIVLGWAMCILLAAGSAIYGMKARTMYQNASAVLDSLASIQCVPRR